MGFGPNHQLCRACAGCNQLEAVGANRYRLANIVPIARHVVDHRQSRIVLVLFAERNCCTCGAN